MSKLIEFRNTNFAYNSNNAFNDFNMEIMEGDIVTLVGAPASGKTTLLKMLVHKLPNDAVYYKGIPISKANIDEVKNNVVVIFDSKVTSPTVELELKKYVAKLGISPMEIEERLALLDKSFGISRIKDLNPKALSTEELYLVKILRYLIIFPRFLAIDMILSNLSEIDIKKFFDFVHKNKITLLNVTNDLNLALYGNKLLVLESFVLILEGNTQSVLKTDTLLKRLGFKLPLPVELSIELNHYDVLNKVYTDKEKLVSALWK